MDVVDHLLGLLKAAAAPSVAYHYTSARALHGIVESGSIWATDSRFLNDTMELQYALDRASQTISELCGSLPTSDHDALDMFSGALGDVPKARVYVASFSEENDSLPQWRGYCPTTGGFAIGIATPPLEARQDCHFLQCVYDAAQQGSLVHELIGFLLNRYRTFPSDDSEDVAAMRLGRLSLEFLEGILILAAVFKHPSFAEEREWRIVLIDSYSADISERDEKISFREGRSGLVPYIAYSLVRAVQSSNFPEVRVGPNPHIALACDASVSFMRASGHETTVIQSTIPYRAW